MPQDRMDRIKKLKKEVEWEMKRFATTKGYRWIEGKDSAGRPTGMLYFMNPKNLEIK